MNAFTRTNPPAYPTDHYHADAVFDLQRGSEWGTLTDGPANFNTVVLSIASHFDERPDATRLRIWHFQPDTPPIDVTADVIAAMEWPEYEADADDYGDWKRDQMIDRMEDVR